MEFKSITPTEITDNTFSLIAKDWMLIAAGTESEHNCMTASWGGFGVLWFKNVAFVFIRPQRHTLEFLNTHEHFTLNFFDNSYRNVLNFCGSKSGRDVNKTKECNLHPFATENNAVAFSEARMVIECKKLYADPFKKEAFIDETLLKHYAKDDYHIMFVGEITNCFVK
ncbi:MAG: flavin reductase [Bacteroidales bacterium]|jgi:flavin reductase (DIM6/NTAB) family NADH-FMN oxidoreductase RutF|nr:flavin reductase [Bacteroidales bacterium]